MAGTVKIWTYIEVVDGNGQLARPMGRTTETVPVTITTGSSPEIHDQTHSVAAAGTIKLFDVADDLGSFVFLAVSSDQNGTLAIIADDDGDNGEAGYEQEIVANVPFILPSDTALASDGTLGSFDGTADVVERLNFKNTSASTARVRVLAVK